MTPDADYELDTITVKQGETVIETAEGTENNTCIFKMPAGDVTVTATFTENDISEVFASILDGTYSYDVTA